MSTDDELYVDSTEATRMLGVSLQTLYAYVSRKQLRSERIKGSRSRKYWRADVERLAGSTSDQVFPASPAALVSETKITLLTAGGMYFRGHDAIALSQHATLESLAALLWQVEEASVFSDPPVDASDVWHQLRPSLSELSAPERMIAMFPMIERANVRSYELSPQSYARTGADVLRWCATLLVKAPKPSTQPLHLFVSKALKAEPGFDDVIRRLLVLAADHEFDPITFAVRTVANVGVTAYQAVTTGLIASQGQRFQAERYGSAMRFLHEILASKNGRMAVVRRLRSGEPMPGFSEHTHDPRTIALMDSLERSLRGSRELRRIREAECTVKEASGASMEFIVPALFVGHHLGLHGDELSIAALGRMVGWIAHAMEQFHGSPLIRPRASYVGPLPTDASS